MLETATTVFCRHCSDRHPARIERRGDAIVGAVDCPVNPRTVELSDDADLFLHLRRLDGGGIKAASEFVERPATRAQIYITEACNWSCPVCYASAEKSKNGAQLSVSEIVRRAAAARAGGVRRILLLGGEPTVHPELLEIVRRVRSVGVAVSLATNGELIGRDPEMARRLRRAGLGHLNLQFDTLARGTMQRLRGRADLELKQAAIAHTVAAGLPYSLTVTMTALNVGEAGELVQWAAALPVMPSLILFQSLVRCGRFPTDLHSVSRERVIKSLLASGAVPGLGRDHLHTLPPVPPQALPIHPDCGTLVFLLRRGGTLAPADLGIDVAGFKQAVVGDGSMRRNWAGWAFAFLRHLRPGFRLELLKALLGLRPGSANRRLVVLGFTSFCDPDFLEADRLARCGNHVLLPASSEPVCCHFGRQKPSTHLTSRISR